MVNIPRKSTNFKASAKAQKTKAKWKPLKAKGKATMAKPSMASSLKKKAKGKASSSKSMSRLQNKQKPPHRFDRSGDHHLRSWAEMSKDIDNTSWLITDLVLMGYVTLIVGPPKAGKSVFCLEALVKPMITKAETFWCTGDPNPYSEFPIVMWIDTEYNIAGALTHAREFDYPLGNLVSVYDKQGVPLTIDLGNDEHLKLIVQQVQKYDIKLVVIDSLSGGHSINENNTNDMKTIMRNLCKIAEKTKAAVVVVHHSKKTTGDQLKLNDSRGSNAILQLARSILTYEELPNSVENVRRLKYLGGNYAKQRLEFGVKLTDSGLQRCTPPKPIQNIKARDKAKEFLLQNMKAGRWHSSKTIKDQAEAEGIPQATLYRARKVLCETRHGKWRIPPGEVDKLRN